METADSEAQKIFALLIIYGGRGLIEGEIDLARGHSSRDAVTAALVAEGLVTVRTRLISRRKVYMLSAKGSKLLQAAHKRVLEFTPSQTTNDKGGLQYGWKAASADRPHPRGLPNPQ